MRVSILGSALSLALIMPGLAMADEVFIVSDGILAVDAGKLQEEGINITSANGEALSSVIPVAAGQSVSTDTTAKVSLSHQTVDLAAFDLNKDGYINEKDAPWEAMYLSVDYNKNGVIEKGEYALIGECGIDALFIDTPNGNVWSFHTSGARKIVKEDEFS